VSVVDVAAPSAPIEHGKPPVQGAEADWNTRPVGVGSVTIASGTASGPRFETTIV